MSQSLTVHDLVRSMAETIYEAHGIRMVQISFAWDVNPMIDGASAASVKSIEIMSRSP